MRGLKEILTRGVEKIYPSFESLEKKLNGGKKLRVYYGIDPTSPNIHIGHSVPLRKLRKFQDAGHKVLLLFGDFTGMIGDPSGRDTKRQPLSREQVLKNTSAYKQQVSKVLDFDKNSPEIVYNSQWWGKMSLNEFFGILSKFTVSQLLERDMFQERMRKKQSVGAHEFLYPILQGYDSVALDVDLEIGASDQTFNMLVGRGLQKSLNNKEKFVLTTPLLEGTDGRKMSKTYNNTIDITTNADDMYGKTMSIKDGLIIKYLELVTDSEEKEIEDVTLRLKNKSLNPMEAKKKLAYELVKIYHGEAGAKKAQEGFERVFQKGEAPSPKEIQIKNKNPNIIDFLMSSGQLKSRSQAKRIVDQGGIRVNERVISNPNEEILLKEGSIIRIGKRKAIKISLTNS